MRCPRLTELPPPPIGKTGWPWTEETAPLPATMSEGRPWPSISIVTPSFNQGVYLEETVRSILLQGYPNLEHILIDGGSTDGSVAIIKKYARWLTYWVGERDRGQAHAINKGLARCTGEVFNWINSDDYLAPGTLGKIAAAFPGADAVAGTVINFDEAGIQDPRVPRILDAKRLILADCASRWHQPGLWLRREGVIACGGIDESYDLSFDWDLTIRYLSLFPLVKYLPEVFVHFRVHPQAKTASLGDRFTRERYRILHKLCDTLRRPSLRNACQQQIRRVDWGEIVAHVRGDDRRPRLLRALQLGVAACSDPRNRVTRFTMGAIRRVLFPATDTEAPKEVRYGSTR